MSAYVVAEVEVTDPASYEEYRKMVPATIARYGGKYLVRGGAVETKEGSWQPKRLVVLEFASMDQAQVVPLAGIRAGARAPHAGGALEGGAGGGCRVGWASGPPYIDYSGARRITAQASRAPALPVGCVR